MNWKNAGIRAVRSLIQGTVVALTAFLAAAAKRGTFVGINEDAQVFFFAEALAVGYAALSFLQNLLEDNTGFSPPKG